MNNDVFLPLELSNKGYNHKIMEVSKEQEQEPKLYELKEINDNISFINVPEGKIYMVSTKGNSAGARPVVFYSDKIESNDFLKEIALIAKELIDVFKQRWEAMKKELDNFEEGGLHFEENEEAIKEEKEIAPIAKELLDVLKQRLEFKLATDPIPSNYTDKEDSNNANSEEKTEDPKPTKKTKKEPKEGPKN